VDLILGCREDQVDKPLGSYRAECQMLGRMAWPAAKKAMKSYR
jgi:hypothetical protein